MKGLHLIVKGRVQGVGFRYYTKRRADSFAIVGTVENKYDGSVEIFAFGELQKIKPFLETIHRGPGHSYVREIIKTEIAVAEHRGFAIL